MDAFLCTILNWPCNFAPLGWAFCAGQTLSISQNTAVFSLLGTTYGGDGVTTFVLPNLQSRVPVGAGTGTGLSTYNLGDQSGAENIGLTIGNLPAHTHTATPSGLSASVPAVTSNGTTNQASSSVVLAAPTDSARNPINIYSNAAQNATLASGTVTGSVTVGLTGNGVAHSNIQPYLALNYIIALQGIFPSRN